MNFRDLSVAAATGLAMMAGASFASPVDTVVSQLHTMGYANISVTRTMLGRARIVAEKDNHAREIVIHPRSGEILRDAVDTGRGWTNAVTLGNGTAKSGETGNGSSNETANGGGNGGGGGNSGGGGNGGGGGGNGGGGGGNGGGGGGGNGGGNGNGNSGR